MIIPVFLLALSAYMLLMIILFLLFAFALRVS